jgi:hypothetical protein
VHNLKYYGSAKDVAFAKDILEPVDMPGMENKDRAVIQAVIDRYKIKATILYDGNTVWSYDRVIRDFKRALKSKPGPVTDYGSGEWDMTDYLYKFLSLVCGSIAHYSKGGWIGAYPKKSDLVKFCFNNEFGQNIVAAQPAWATDRVKICGAILVMLGNPNINKWGGL